MKAFQVLDRHQDVHHDLLLEASAGTGKTFSIENLVVRLLIEGEKPLLLEEMLVVTFTREAAFDLKIRIRGTIEKAITALKNHDFQVMDYLAPLEQKETLKRLHDALLSFDQAQIFTIHSFCSKMLREHVFESDIGIEALKGDEQVDQREILAVVRDFFRIKMKPDFISAAELQLVLSKHFGDIQGLERALVRSSSDSAKISVPHQEENSYPVIYGRIASACQQMVWQYLEEEEKFRYDDLLKKVQKASCNKSFVGQIEKRYRAAIIDEFQDTDTVQLDIFRNLFHGKSALYLVGDPKQSIYAFRRADIYTYLSAVNTLGEESRASLDTNFRSQSSLIDALNGLFSQHSSPDWIALPRLNTSLPYPEVKASFKVAESGLSDALHFFIAEDSEGKGQLEQQEQAHFFPFIRQEIGRLKTLSKIAVLVRDHRQANRLAAYLEENGIACGLQRSQSLAHCAAFGAWKELLQAVNSPRDESSLKKALGGQLFGWTHADIRRLDDHHELEAVLARMQRLRRILEFDGVAFFFEELLKETAESLLSRQKGEEFFNDLQQIADLLIEEQSRTQASTEGLIQYLNSFGEEDENLKKRCDLDREAVRILTIHSSKGLEFDFVFALGLLSRTPKEDLFIPMDGALVPACSANTEALLQHLKEVDAEKMRQLYVALTRAKHRLYVPVLYAPRRKAPDSGTASAMELFLARLGQSPVYTHEELYERIATLNKEQLLSFLSTNPHTGYTLLNETQLSFEPLPKAEPPLLTPPKECRFDWQPAHLLSFTSLTKARASGGYLAAPHDFQSAVKSVHTLPSGSTTGILIHEIFESIPFGKNREDRDAEISMHLAATRFEPWKETICQLVDDVMHTDLQGFCLADIQPRNLFRETEFIYPSDGHNFLKGVIDFIFSYEGKYYLVDWKSNWLGPEGKEYSLPKLAETMKQHHYLLQAKIYKEALRRYLQVVEEKDFEECFGGTFYLFVRGMDPQVKGQGVYYDPS